MQHKSSLSIDKVLIYIFIISAITYVVIFFLVPRLSAYTIDTPISGGVINEFNVGEVRFINPILASSRVDKDLSSLIYSGLVRRDENGNIINDLAESWEVNASGTEYIFKIKKGVLFHDNVELTSEDVKFTINSIQNEEIQSPIINNWQRVEVDTIDRYTVSIKLPRTYSPFIFNMTIGIVPKHIFDVTGGGEERELFLFNDGNTRPIGTGPYEVRSIETTSDSTTYTLSAYDRFTLGKPLINTLIYSIFKDEESLIKAIDNKRSVATHIIDAEHYEDAKVLQSNTNTSFAIYFNKNVSDILSRKEVREAIRLVTPKERIIQDTSLAGNARIIDGPILMTPDDLPSFEERSEQAKILLEDNEWFLNEFGIYEKDGEELSFKLTIPDVQIGTEFAFVFSRMLQEFGIDISIIALPEEEFNIRVRNRDFEIIFVGNNLSKGFDLFPFFHSSQINDPGLNISNFVNIKADEALEESRIVDIAGRDGLYSIIEEEIQSEVSSIFLYSPFFTYLIPEDIKGIKLGVITSPEDRFESINKWHFQTLKTWNILR